MIRRSPPSRLVGPETPKALDSVVALLDAAPGAALVAAVPVTDAIVLLAETPVAALVAVVVVAVVVVVIIIAVLSLPIARSPTPGWLCG